MLTYFTPWTQKHSCENLLFDTDFIKVFIQLNAAHTHPGRTERYILRRFNNKECFTKGHGFLISLDLNCDNVGALEYEEAINSIIVVQVEIQILFTCLVVDTTLFPVITVLSHIPNGK